MSFTDRAHLTRELAELRAWLDRRFTRLERIVALSAAALAEEIDTETTRIAGVLDQVRSDLAAALADQNADTDAAVQDALNVLAPTVERLKSVGRDPEQPVPDPVPEDEPGADTFE